jgi:hypothetical protein
MTKDGIHRGTRDRSAPLLSIGNVFRIEIRDFDS